MASLTLPTDSQERKEYPMFRGLLAYFPAALAGVAKHSKAGNDKHNPGEELHHARGKSMDHEDCIVRHLVDLGDLQRRLDENSNYGRADWLGLAVLDEANALAWRALALSQELHEKFDGAPLAPAAKLPREPALREACRCEPGRCAQLGYSGDVGVCRDGERLGLVTAEEIKRGLPVAEGWPAQRCALCREQPCSCKEPNTPSPKTIEAMTPSQKWEAGLITARQYSQLMSGVPTPSPYDCSIRRG